MVRTLLQWLGVVFVLGLLAAATATLLVVKDRVRVVVQMDEPETGADPVALLRDDVAALQRDLGELRGSLAAQFERLGAALDERAAARHGDVQQVASTVAQVARAQDACRSELARLVARFEAVERSLAHVAELAAAAPRVALVPEPAVAPAAAPAEPAAAPVLEPPAPPPLPDVPAPAAKPPAFLSFSVAPVKFQFDQEQDYALVPELCRVGFDAKSTLHDFSGVTSKVKGRFTADLDDPRGAFRGEVECEAKGLSTGLAGRDTNMAEHLDAAHHPAIRFVIGSFEPAAVDVGKQTAEGTIVGQMTIRGTAREVRMPIRISVDPSRRIVVEGHAPLKLSDYKVPVPSQLGGTITMQDEVDVWIALRARVQMGDRK
jgi:polyisoprenoid-binding protein YceI